MLKKMNEKELFAIEAMWTMFGLTVIWGCIMNEINNGLNSTISLIIEVIVVFLTFVLLYGICVSCNKEDGE